MRILFSTTLLLVSLFGYAQTHWALRPNESQINFKVQHLGWAEAEGSFKAEGGRLFLDEKGRIDSVHLTVKCESVNTGIELRDENIKDEDWLNCPQFPEITYHTTRILKTTIGYDVQGILQIKGVKHKKIVPIEVQQSEGQIKVEAFIKVDRYEFGVGGSASFPAGREIKLDISLVFEKK